MQTDGLQRLLDFTALLGEKGIRFRVERQRPEALMITFSRNGIFVEAEFFAHEIEFSYFRERDAGQYTGDVLDHLLREHWGD